MWSQATLYSTQTPVRRFVKNSTESGRVLERELVCRVGTGEGLRERVASDMLLGFGAGREWAPKCIDVVETRRKDSDGGAAVGGTKMQPVPVFPRRSR